MSDMNYRFLNATGELVAFCDQARESGWLALDTEFVRERTYFAQLGLVQLAIPEQNVLLDPLQEIDMSSLWQLLADPEVVKVVHAGGEDLELLHQQSGLLPQNVFDSQIACTVLGIGDAMGYAAMVLHFFDVELDKSQSRTNWLARPLTPEQEFYAVADAYYLAKIYPQLMQQLTDRDRLSLVADECALQIAKRTRELPLDLAWRDLGNAWQVSDQQRACLQELASWRLQTARKKDKPLGFIVKDAALIEIARGEITDLHALSQVADMHPQTIRRYGEAIIAAVKLGLERPVDEIPPAMPRLDFEAGYKALFKKAKQLVKDKADELEVSASFVGSRKQINEVFHWCWFVDDELKRRLPVPDLLAGWRGALLKSELETLLQPRA
ncbi:ribonuclease D [Aliidiomarina minuta]|uniref:Ribonuclease D n=1 Tax=Aliidiomarina minuta TaxID=880057 RepID=A0A432W7U7_9GAMM|nr:ribonuclease D [Aliidiomarina minuta]RUO26173.1 ribonuclease D [Aliidiomarina minuta]